MKCAVFAFTDNGKQLRDRLCELEHQITLRDEYVEFCAYNLKEDVAKAFETCEGIIFVSATGIAVRLIAPFIQDKLLDPAVIVIDELSNFVIPISSGHVGGANELSRRLASAIGAIPVITTATDVNGVIAVDEVAADNGLEIIGRDNIKSVNKKLLLNQPVNLALEDDVVVTVNGHEIREDELGLIFRPIVIGIGCRRGKSVDELRRFVLDTLNELMVDITTVVGIATIDIKSDEEGLNALSNELHIPIKTYTAKELSSVEGDFEQSEFVEKTVGVSDVSARAAKCAGKHGKFILKKKKQDGMTISVFEKYKRITINHEET